MKETVISSLQIWLNAHWKSNTDWKKGSWVLESQKMAATFRHVSGLHQSNGVLVQIFSFPAREWLKRRQSHMETELLRTREAQNAVTVVHSGILKSLALPLTLPHTTGNLWRYTFFSVHINRAAHDATNQIWQMGSALPYNCKHGIEVLALSTVEGNFNKMLNNLHPFELVGLC